MICRTGRRAVYLFLLDNALLSYNACDTILLLLMTSCTTLDRDTTIEPVRPCQDTLPEGDIDDCKEHVGRCMVKHTSDTHDGVTPWWGRRQATAHPKQAHNYEHKHVHTPTTCTEHQNRCMPNSAVGSSIQSDTTQLQEEEYPRSAQYE